ncbi:hypothetical protein Tco_1258147, partial [Tanacetum coccineum]
MDTLRARVVSAEQEIASLLAKARAAKQQDVISRARISELEHSALTWWNSYMKTVGIDAAYEMSWKELIKMMTKCFQELALLCLRMVPDEENKIKGYIWGLPDNIQRNVTSAEPIRLQDAVRLANSLMDQKVRASAARQAENKRRWESNQGNNQHPSGRIWQGPTLLGLEKESNQNHGNQAGNGKAQGRAYALGGGEANQDPNVIT